MGAPNTQGILNEIVTLLQGLSGSATLTSVTLGGLKAYTPDKLPAGVVQLKKESSDHYAMGGAVRNTMHIRLRFVVDYTTASTAEAQIVAIRDAVDSLFQQHATLAAVSGVADSRIEPNSGTYGFASYNSVFLRVYEVELRVIQQYYLTVSN